MGTPLGLQQKLMRHADIGTTMNYGDPAAEDMRAANEKVVQLVMSRDELISE
jgi:integrase